MTEYENLIAGPFPLQKDTVTIGGNQNLKAWLCAWLQERFRWCKRQYVLLCPHYGCCRHRVRDHRRTETFVSTRPPKVTTIPSTKSLTSLPLPVNASSLVAFEATADKSNALFFEAKAVGTWAGE